MEPDDAVLDLMSQAFFKDRVSLSAAEAILSEHLLDNGFATKGELCDLLWLDEDSLADFDARLRVHFSHIREKYGNKFELVTLRGIGYKLVRLSDFPITRVPPTDPLAALALDLLDRYNIKSGYREASVLKSFCDLRFVSNRALDTILWPDRPGDDLKLMRWRYLLMLRKKFGDLIKIRTFPNYGYAMERLGPADNPMHERR